MPLSRHTATFGFCDENSARVEFDLFSVAGNLDSLGYRIRKRYPDLPTVISADPPLAVDYSVFHTDSRRLIRYRGRFVDNRWGRSGRLDQRGAEKKAAHYPDGNSETVVTMTAPISMMVRSAVISAAISAIIPVVVSSGKGRGCTCHAQENGCRRYYLFHVYHSFS